MIKNKNIMRYLEVILNKNFDKVEEKEYDNIKTIVFSKQNDDKTQEYVSDELLSFKNLEQVIFRESTILEEDIDVLASLTKLNRVVFSKCFFRDSKILEKLSSIKNLSFRECYNEDYSFFNKLKDLETLAIIEPYIEAQIDLSSFENLSNLKKLTLQSCNLKNIEKLGLLTNLKNMSLLFSTFEDKIDFLNSLSKLEELYIPEKYIKFGKYGNTTIYNSYAHLLMDGENNIKKIV